VRLLLLNPYAWLIAAAVLLSSGGGGYWWGHTAAATSCKAAAIKPLTKAANAGARRDAHVDAIGQASAAATDAALNRNRNATDESAQRIRTVVVPGPCRLVDPGILRELRNARDGTNAALGVGVRQGAAGAGAVHP
jgi:hypothetical protein